MLLPFAKEIFDPVHGFIKLTQTEVTVIDHLLFQRLQNISQLGPIHLVYPSAKSSRFSHSLGVLSVISKMIENFKVLPQTQEKLFERFILQKNNEELIRNVALLHDIGHLPFSHCTEQVIKDYLSEKLPDKIKDQPKVKFHEWLSGEIVKKTNIFNPSSQTEEIKTRNRENISQIITGSSAYLLFNQMMHSELDADRLDYIARDSFSTGISFGQIDLNQILRNIFVKQVDSSCNETSDNIIVYSNKAISAIDNYYYARTFMYKSVYFHKINAYFGFLISEIYRILITSEELSTIKKCLPLKPEEILSYILNDPSSLSEENEKALSQFMTLWHNFDDYYLWECMRRCWHKIDTLSTSKMNNDLYLLKTYLDLLMRRKKSDQIWILDRLNFNSKEAKKSDRHLKEILSELEKWIATEFCVDCANQKLPLIVINNSVDAPLAQIDLPNPINLNDDYEPNFTLFYDFQTKTYSYLNNVPSSINFQSNLSKFYIFRVFTPPTFTMEGVKEKIGGKFHELELKYS